MSTSVEGPHLRFFFADLDMRVFFIELKNVPEWGSLEDRRREPPECLGMVASRKAVQRMVSLVFVAPGAPGGDT